MKRHTEFWLFVFCFFVAIGCTRAADPVVISAQPASLLQHADIFMDPSGKLSANELLSQPYANWFSHYNTVTTPYPPSRQTVYWLKFSINNPSPYSQVKLIEFSSLSRAVAELIDIETLEQLSALDNTGLQKKPFFYELTLPPQSSRSFLLSLKNTDLTTISLELRSVEQTLKKAMENKLFSGVMLGLMAMALINCGIIYFRNQDTIFFVLGANIAGVMAFILILQNKIGYLANWQPLSLQAISWICGTALLCNYLFLIQNNIVKRWPVTVKLTFFILIILSILVYSLSFNTAWAIGILMMILFSCYQVTHLYIYFLRSNFKPILYLVIIKSFLAICWVGSVTAGTLLWISPELTERIIISGHVIEVICLITLFLVNLIERKIFIESQKTAAVVSQSEKKYQADMLHQMSHNLRTPLSSIMGMSDVLAESDLGHRQRDHIDILRSASNELLNSIDTLFEASQLLNNYEDDVSKHQVIELQQLIFNCIENFQIQADYKGIELIHSLETNLPEAVLGNSQRLRQIIIQLLDNAFKQSTAGEIVLRAGCIHQDKKFATLHFSISDTGIGLSLSEQQTLLNVFQQSDLQTGQSSNINLKIAYQLIESIGGKFGVDSNEGKGANVWFDITLPKAELRRPLFSNPSKFLAGKQVLIVDDNATCCKAITQQIAPWGIQSTTALSGSEALAIIHDKAIHQEYFDLLLVDYSMPGMNGLQFVQRLTEDPIYEISQPRIIMLTGVTRIPTTELSSLPSVREVLVKPASNKDLAIAMSNALLNSNEDSETESLFEISDYSSDSNVSQNNILLVEDNSINAKITAGMLAQLGYDYEIARNGLEALDALQSETYDLILMDCDLPLMNGFEATQQLRQWERERHYPRTPVIALSANTEAEQGELSKKAGMDDYLEKPIRIAQLQQTLDKWRSEKRDKASPPSA